MKTIGMAAFLIMSAAWALASDFNLPTLKYELCEPGTLPSASASGRKMDASVFELPSIPKRSASIKGISREGIVRPPHGTDYKLRILKAPKLDQEIIKSPDTKR